MSIVFTNAVEYIKEELSRLFVWQKHGTGMALTIKLHHDTMILNPCNFKIKS